MTARSLLVARATYADFIACITGTAQLLVLLIAVAFVGLLGCGPPPPPKPPLRELPAPATAILASAPAAYSDPNPIAMPNDRGSAAALAAFASITGGAVEHEPALDLVAAVVGTTYAEHQELPADALLQWLYWKCGATSAPGPVNVLVAPEDSDFYFQQHIQTLGQALRPNEEHLSFGVARVAAMGYVAQAIVIGFRPVHASAITKSQAPSAKVPVRVTLTKPYANLTLFVDQSAGDVLELPMAKEADGSFSAEAPLPAATGRYFIEVVGVEVPPDGAVEKGWRNSLLWLPLFVGIPEPAAADEFIRRPQKNSPNLAAWSMQILNAYNEQRTRLGRSPLAFEEAPNLIAQSKSQDYAGLDSLPPPDLNLYAKLATAGAPARNVHGYVDQIEFVSEYITLRLLRPAARHALLDPAMTTLALGLAPRRVEPTLGLHRSVEYVFEHIHVDPPKERERVLSELDALQTKAGGSAMTHSDALSAAAQSVVDEVCLGGPKPTDAKGIFARAGLPPTLHRRTAVPWLGYDLSKEEIARIQEGAKDGGYTDVGVGVCQGTIEGRAGVVMALTLFAGP